VDFVINTAAVVDYRLGLQTRELIKQYGYDWDGPSAGEYTYNNISFMLDVAQEIEEICPNAWLTQP
jgi:alpha-galactosidase/6-phospho-beta-glucosidase family protein